MIYSVQNKMSLTLSLPKRDIPQMYRLELVKVCDHVTRSCTVRSIKKVMVISFAGFQIMDKHQPFISALLTVKR